MIAFIKEYAALIATLGLIGIEISPIKINPIKWCLRHIGNLLNQDIKKDVNNLTNEVNTLSSKVDKLEEKDDFKAVSDIKKDVTNFHALLVGYGLDENQYRRCFELEEDYKKYKKKYPGKINGHLDAIFEAVHTNYSKGNILTMEVKSNEKQNNFNSFNSL